MIASSSLNIIFVVTLNQVVVWLWLLLLPREDQRLSPQLFTTLSYITGQQLCECSVQQDDKSGQAKETQIFAEELVN